MCSIIASYSKSVIEELAALNAYRGQHSHSVYVFKKYTNELLYSHRDLGQLNINNHKLPEGYIICHQQAPTTENKQKTDIHPAQVNNHLLWHNGIIKEKAIKTLQADLESTSSWDTKLLLKYLIYYDKPSTIDGTFSCIWYNGTNLILFRNEISPLFIDKNLNISSTKFDGSQSIAPNKMFVLDSELIEIGSFKTVENPYYFGD